MGDCDQQRCHDPLTLRARAPPGLGHHATPHDAIRAQYGDKGAASVFPARPC
jgi:hypothetical protein